MINKLNLKMAMVFCLGFLQATILLVHAETQSTHTQVQGKEPSQKATPTDPSKYFIATPKAQIDSRSVTPDSAGDKPGLSGKAYCDDLFKPVSIEVLENYTNGQVYERENELINCAITYINQEPKNDEEGYQALLQIREVNNANNILLARMKQFINQKGLTHEFLFPPKK